MKRLTVILGLLAALALAGSAAAAAPANTAAPTISGTPKSGSTLTASNGTWSNSPTSYTYQWRRCATDGTACGDIVGATHQTYTLAAADVHHTIRVRVTAANADGKASATSGATEVIGTANGPSNTVKPSVSGTAAVGDELTVSNGSWSPAATSYTYQWQRCSSTGTSCLNVVGAIGRTYGVRAADVGSKMRALVTAHVSTQQTTVASGTSDTVQSNTTTTTVTTTVAGNKAPSIKFISLKRVGARVYARFRVCDDRLGKITVVERDNKARALSYTRRFSVYRTLSCGTFARHWIPAPRFRTKGRYVVTLRAIDKSGALSRLVSRSLFRR
jgi:Tfp pilus assembly major pilin PilA